MAPEGVQDQAYERWSPQTRDREQGRALAHWLDHEVRPFSPWWAARLTKVEIARPADLEQVAFLEEAEAAAAGGPGNPALLVLPTEDEFKRHASRAELVAAAREVGGRSPGGRRAALFRRYKPVHVHDGGVATGLVVAYTRSDLDRLHLAGARLCTVLGLGAEDSMVSAVPAGAGIRFWGLYHAALAARITALHPRTGGQDPAEAVAHGLSMLPATVLALPVEEALETLAGLRERRVRIGTVRTLLTVGPPPGPGLRIELAAAAAGLGASSARVQAVWAPAASRVLWGECRPPSADPAQATFGLHTYPDLEVLEVRDPDAGIGVGEGQEGELVLTSLGWRGTVLVRYATGAWTGGLVTSVTCPGCGRSVPRLAPEAAEAAWQPAVDAGDGTHTTVDLRRVRGALEAAGIRDPAVRDWSLRERGGALVLGLDLADKDRALATHLGTVVASAVGVAPEVHLGQKAAASRPQIGLAGPRTDLRG
jgi:hypothetical protein